jgi:hypothetical protein
MKWMMKNEAKNIFPFEFQRIFQIVNYKSCDVEETVFPGNTLGTQ